MNVHFGCVIHLDSETTTLFRVWSQHRCENIGWDNELTLLLIARRNDPIISGWKKCLIPKIVGGISILRIGGGVLLGGIHTQIFFLKKIFCQVKFFAKKEPTL